MPDQTNLFGRNMHGIYVIEMIMKRWYRRQPDPAEGETVNSWLWCCKSLQIIIHELDL
jgi:hypothetical protein